MPVFTTGMIGNHGDAKMIEIKGSKFHNYTMLVDGNGGEEQFVVIVSPSQCGKSPLVIVTAQCDGGAEVVTRKWVKHEKLAAEVETALIKWVSGGIKPTLEQLAAEKPKISTAMKKFQKYHLV